MLEVEGLELITPTRTINSSGREWVGGGGVCGGWNEVGGHQQLGVRGLGGARARLDAGAASRPEASASAPVPRDGAVVAGRRGGSRPPVVVVVDAAIGDAGWRRSSGRSGLRPAGPTPGPTGWGVATVFLGGFIAWPRDVAGPRRRAGSSADPRPLRAPGGPAVSLLYLSWGGDLMVTICRHRDGTYVRLGSFVRPQDSHLEA